MTDPTATPTTNYHWLKPVVGASPTTWGQTLNDDLDAIDAQVFSIGNGNNLNVASTPGTSIPGTLSFINSAAPAGQKVRWTLTEDTVVESGGNAGSNLSIKAYSDTGALISTPLSFTRSTAAASFSAALNVNGAATVGGTLGVIGAATVGGNLTAGAGNLFVTSSTATFAGAATIGGNLTAGAGNLTISSVGASIVSSLSVGPSLTVKATAGSPSPQIALLTSGGTTQSTWTWNSVANAVSCSFGAAYWLIDATGSFTVSGATAYKPGGGSWTAPSDERIKNIEDDYTAGLEEVLQLRPVTYTFKGNDALAEGEPSRHAQLAEDGTVLVGLIAQEVEAIFPGMVSQREGYIDGEKVTDLRDINTSELIFALVNAVKHLAAEVQELKAAR